MDLFAAAVLVITGFTACTEFGSYVFVHPVIRRLPPARMIAFEQGLLGTFGRAFPVLIPLTAVLLVVHAASSEDGPSAWRWLAVAAWAIATVTTLIVNVPINKATSTWDPESPPEGWRELRRKWDIFQAVRAWLLLLAFVLVSVDLAVPGP